MYYEFLGLAQVYLVLFSVPEAQFGCSQPVGELSCPIKYIQHFGIVLSEILRE